jgi:hypothetical protein
LYLRSQGLKGVGAKVVCLEEASRLDPAVFQEVIVPLLGVKDTAVLGISTPLDDTNFYSQMTEMKQEDGKTPLFNVITISLICEECAAKDMQGQITCPHKQNEIPPWKTERRQALVRKLLESNPELYKREQLGVITGNNNNAFPAQGISRFEATSAEHALTIDVLFCCIDPAGGGSSCAAVLSGYLYDGRSKVMVRSPLTPAAWPTRRTCSPTVGGPQNQSRLGAWRLYLECMRRTRRPHCRGKSRPTPWRLGR